MLSKITQHRTVREFKIKALDWWDNLKISFIVFWDFKYKRKRKENKKLLKDGDVEKIPVKRAVKKDVKEMSYSADQTSNSMKYVKTKSGAVVVTPASMREIRRDYKDCELVEARIKSHEALREENAKPIGNCEKTDA